MKTTSIKFSFFDSALLIWAGSGVVSLFINGFVGLPLDEWVKVVYYSQAVVALAYFGIRNHLKGIANAVAEGQASQGAREQGRASTRSSGSEDKGDSGRRTYPYAHYHRPVDGLGTPSEANDCFYAVEGKGGLCIFRERTFSYLDSVGLIDNETVRFPQRYES